MVKKITICLCALFFLLITSCAMTNRIENVEVLPSEWWEKSGQNIQDSLRSDGKGYYSNVIVLIGQSDSVKNSSEFQALDSANLDANAAFSEFIESTILNETVKNNSYKEIDGSSGEELEQKIEEILNVIESNISKTQYSLLKVQGEHTEENERNGIKYYKGWVCCTISEGVIRVIEDITKEVFEMLIGDIENNTPTIAKPQELVITGIVEAPVYKVFN